MKIVAGKIILDEETGARLALAFWRNQAWSSVESRIEGECIVGELDDARASLRLDPSGEGEWRYSLSLTAERETRVQLALEIPGVHQPFHLIPCCIFGDNNLERAEPGHFPNLTTRFPGNVSCSPYWEFRADRAAVPLSAIAFGRYVGGISVAPYSPCAIVDGTGRDGFVRNGLFSRLAHDGLAAACGITLGYRNMPRSFVNKDQWGVPTEHLLRKGTVQGRIMVRSAADRRGIHGLVRQVYPDLHEEPDPLIATQTAVESLVDAFHRICWCPDREHFTNLNTLQDPLRKELRPWRSLAEIGWSGGAAIAYPLLVAGTRLRHTPSIERASNLLDWVARAFNPASGLLWDVCGKNEGCRTDGWWSGYLVRNVHCAYTNANALFNLLKAYAHCRENGDENRGDWLKTACRALDTACALQRSDGNFGYTYSPETPKVVDFDGFVGSQFAAALALAYQETGVRRYLEAAERGIAYYAPFVRNLDCWGAPMDTWKSHDEEGNLGFMRAARLLHEITGDEGYLGMLADSAEYEYLWRYAYRARPEYPPLKGSPWSSCGGSVTSVSNPHIHPMALIVSAELEHLARTTGDPYHRSRLRDGLLWARNIVGLYPTHTGYGAPGVLTERWCPSDGLTIERYPDGSPSSIWFSYNGWAAAAVLEGLVDSEDDSKTPAGQ